MSRLGTTHRALGDLRTTRQLEEQAVAGFRRVLGQDHPDTIHNEQPRRDPLGLGDLEGARQLGEQAVAGHRRVLGDDHPSTLAAMSHLAATRRALWATWKAPASWKSKRWPALPVLGKDHPDTLATMSNLAATRQALATSREPASSEGKPWPGPAPSAW